MFLTGSDFSGETFKLSTQASFRIKRDLEVKEQYAIPLGDNQRTRRWLGEGIQPLGP